jgi:hypothetical protein
MNYLDLSLNQFELCLSPRGDHFAWLRVLDVPGCGGCKEVNFERDQVPSNLTKATECKTYQAVLDYLLEMEKDERRNCKLIHQHNPKYLSHTENIGFGMHKGHSHDCPIDKMIGFVRLRIKEQNSPHAIFDKIGKLLGRTFDYLSIGTAIPFVGIIPGAVRVIIGLSQTIIGIALAILFAIPAYCYKSESGEVVVQRSIKHIKNGPLNMVIGVLQGTPLLGTWIYYS